MKNNFSTDESVKINWFNSEKYFLTDSDLESSKEKKILKKYAFLHSKQSLIKTIQIIATRFFRNY